MTDPTYVGVAGDWHANYRWASPQVERMCLLLAKLGEAEPIILQAGDYGHWRDGEGMLHRIILTDRLAQLNGQVWFVDGNHEDHSDLQAMPQLQQDTLERVPIITLDKAPRTFWLPRGYRWAWHGRTWLALGGAASIDKDLRTPGFDWFPGETISMKQATIACAPGHADVMLTHDAPNWVPLQMNLPSSMFASDVVRSCDEHRALMTRILDEVQPRWLIHGHYHQGQPRWRHVKAPYGECHVASLPEDGNPANWGILNVKTMEWVY